MPISSTSPISPFSPGLAKKATMNCLYSTTVTSPHSTRNTSMRNRKIRGEDSLASSISIAEREEEPEGIDDVIRCEEPISGTNMAQRCREKRPVEERLGRKRELRGETGLRPNAYFTNFTRLRRLTGFLPQKGIGRMSFVSRIIGTAERVPLPDLVI